jgi:hypothetical protein
MAGGAVPTDVNNLMNLVYIDEEDWNGQLRQAGAAGYLETCDDHMICWVPMEDPIGLVWPFDFYNAHSKAYINHVYVINYYMLTHFHPVYRLPANEGGAAKMAWLRACTIKEGLADPTVAPADMHCKYNLCRRAPRPTEFYVATNWAAKLNQAVAGYNDAAAHAVAAVANPTDAEILATITPINMTFPAMPNKIFKRYIEQNWATMVGFVAYFFRIRGHHWQQEFNDRYEILFSAAQTSEKQTTPGVPWEHFARDVMKAVSPIVLDRYWLARVAEGHCSGNLVVRISSPASGTAGLFALYQGVMDLSQAFPAWAVKNQVNIERLISAVEYLINNRWSGSINHNYYGIPVRVYDESSYAALAATVLAALDTFAENAKLAESKALQRIANGAPITGGVIAKILANCVKSEKMVDSYLDN